MQDSKSTLNRLASMIAERSAKTAVIGLGYVGLPLAVEMAKAGFVTMGFDIAPEKVRSLCEGKNYIQDVDSEEVKTLTSEGKLSATTDFSLLKSCDLISICVPTPLGRGKSPDVEHILNAVKEVKKYLRKGQVIVLESTTYPGTTEEVVLPLLEEGGMKVGQDFYLAFSPERIDPGNKKFALKNTPKIIGGVTKNCAAIAQAFYQTFVEQVITVGSTKAAEMVKILENTFRAINIGLANEVAIMCNHLGIDTWEVIDAAATKPFGFMPFYPGPGLGGHCLPVDPHYLVWKLKLMDYNPRFIQVADEINSSMPKLVVEKIASALNDRSKSLKDSKILVLGVAYKSNIDDYRESPSLEIMRLLQKKGSQVDYHDPYVPKFKLDGADLSSVTLENLSEYDCTVILTNHSCFDIKSIVEASKMVVDTRNATKSFSEFQSKIVKL